MLSDRFLRTTLVSLVLGFGAVPSHAAIPPDGTFVLGFHVRPVSDSGTLPYPKTPDELVSRADAPGIYDVWLYLFSRAPLIGAWSLSVAFDYDGAPGAGVDIDEWTSMMSEFHPQSGWPGAGVGMFGRWDRARCLDPEPRLLAGANGWWIQIVGRATVHVYGPDTIGFGPPEPGVAPQLVECFDEEHDLDGTDSWSRVVPAVFGARPFSGDAPGRLETPALPVTWGSVKARHGVNR